MNLSRKQKNSVQNPSNEKLCYEEEVRPQLKEDIAAPEKEAEMKQESGDKKDQ